MNKNQKFIFVLCMIIVCTLTILSGCDASRGSEQNQLVEVHEYDCDNIEQQLASEIKTAYCRFTCEKNYGGKSCFEPSDMWVCRYEGKIGDCQIVMMGGDEICYTSAERAVEVAGYHLVFGSGQPVYAYYDGNFYTIEEAYERNLLNKADVYQIGTIFHPEFTGKRLPIVMTIAETLPSCVAFEYKGEKPYCFYAYDTEGKLYRVFWNDFTGLNEKDRIVVDHKDDIKALSYDIYPDGGFTPQYEVTAICVYLEDE